MKKSIIAVMVLFFVSTAFSQTKTEIDPAQIPKVLSSYLAKNFTDYSVDKAFKIDDKGSKLTEVWIVKNQEKYSMIFDKDYKLIKKMTLKPDPKVITNKADRKTTAPVNEKKVTEPAKK
jgi:hypothetical protein